MLAILQVLTLAAAFLLPWLIGGLVKFSKEERIRERNLTLIGLAWGAVIIALTVWLTFAASAL